MFGLTQLQLDAIKNVLNKHKYIKKVVIFGSRARGDHKPLSDIDLCIVETYPKAKKTPNIQLDFEELPIPYFVDIIDYQSLTNQELRKNIDLEGKPFYFREISLDKSKKMC
jgi:uncharacterized protein